MGQGWGAFRLVVRRINRFTGYMSAFMIVFSAIAISFEVVSRYFFLAPHDWNLELNTFLLIASTFMAAASTQAARGHVGIEVLDSLLSTRANWWRRFLADLLSAGFCGFIAFHAWRYFSEAWEGGWVTDSVWAPRLWIPYFFMSLGMTTLSLQFLVQILDERILPLVRKE